MSEFEIIKGEGPNGSVKDFPVKVSRDTPWTIEYQDLDGSCRSYVASDLFNALQEMRKELEKAGYQLLCAGARPDVTPSGMSRSMGGGRRAYVVHRGRPASRSEMVDIFDYADRSVVGTVQQQQDFIQAWMESLRRRK